MSEEQNEILRRGDKVIIARGVSRFKVAQHRLTGLFADVLALCYLYASVRLLILQLPKYKEAVKASTGQPVLVRAVGYRDFRGDCGGAVLGQPGAVARRACEQH